MTADLETSVHGTLLRVADTGVLITGPAGSGKSQLALELVRAGHCLVADDLVILRRHADGRLRGRGVETGRGFLLVRGLGVLDVEALFGTGAATGESPVDLQLRLWVDHADQHDDPLRGCRRSRQWLGVAVEELALQASRPGLATLVEVAIQELRLRCRGHRAEQGLSARLGARLRRDNPCE